MFFTQRFCFLHHFFSQNFCIKTFAFFTPKTLLFLQQYFAFYHIFSFFTTILFVFYTKIFVPIFYTNFLHQFFTPIFYTNFLHQFFTPIFYINFLHQFFTPIFYTNFLHQKFCGLKRFLRKCISKYTHQFALPES